MADTLLFRGGSSASIDVANVQSREIVIDTDTDQIVSGASKKKTVMEDSNGKVGIGTATPNRTLQVAGATAITNSADTGAFLFDPAGSVNTVLSRAGQASTTAVDLAIKMGNTEAARIDSSGRLLVGTSGALDVSAGRQLQVADANGAYLILGRDDTTVGDGPGLGGIHFYGNDTTSNAWAKLGSIDCNSDGIQGAGDNPTRLVFSTTADGASSPTERMRIGSSGDVLIGGTLPSAPNIKLDADGSIVTAADATINGLTVGLGGGSIAENTAVGLDALSNNTTGGKNTAIGRRALNSNTVGDRNTAIGRDAGLYIEGSNNTILGAYRGTAADATLSDTVIISTGVTERARCNSNGDWDFGSLILKSPNGTSFRLSVANDGTLSASSI